MFEIEDYSLKQSWNLSNEKKVLILENHLKLLRNHDLLPINFLYQNYRKKLNGAILNEQTGFDMRLQVSVFLNVMFRYLEQKFLILVMAPEYLLSNWFKYLTETAGLKTVTVNANTCPADFDDQHGTALLISFNDIKLTQHLLGYKFFAIIIDCFDEVAKKTIFKSLSGEFHIGLTTRNFYFNPDQKLQWTMLNWCSPGCVGKSNDFCKIDNDNFANFRDNYRHWWFRLTRHFCESLENIVEEEKVTLINISNSTAPKKRRAPTKRSKQNKAVKKLESDDEEIENKSIPNDEIEIEKSEPISPDYKINTDHLLEMKEEPDTLEEIECEKVVSFIDDDDPINLLLSTSMETTPIEATGHINDSRSEEIKLPTHSNEDTVEDKDDILLSLLGDDVETKHDDVLDHEREVSIMKEELSTQIFSEFPTISQRLMEKEDNSEFLMSLID